MAGKRSWISSGPEGTKESGVCAKSRPMSVNCPPLGRRTRRDSDSLAPGERFTTETLLTRPFASSRGSTQACHGVSRMAASAPGLHGFRRREDLTALFAGNHALP